MLKIIAKLIIIGNEEYLEFLGIVSSFDDLFIQIILLFCELIILHVDNYLEVSYYLFYLKAIKFNLPVF